jgi:hypothetical protein
MTCRNNLRWPVTPVQAWKYICSYEPAQLLSWTWLFVCMEEPRGPVLSCKLRKLNQFRVLLPFVFLDWKLHSAFSTGLQERLAWGSKSVWIVESSKFRGDESGPLVLSSTKLARTFWAWSSKACNEVRLDLGLLPFRAEPRTNLARTVCWAWTILAALVKLSVLILLKINECWSHNKWCWRS